VALETKKRDKGGFPWWPIVLILVSAYLFWVLPSQQGEPEVEVQFEPAPKKP
jgi:hypothetical protein